MPRPWLAARSRPYRDALTPAGFTVDYIPLAEEQRKSIRSFDVIVTEWLDRHGIKRLTAWEIPGKALEGRVRALATERGFELTLRASPMFLCARKGAKG